MKKTLSLIIIMSFLQMFLVGCSGNSQSTIQNKGKYEISNLSTLNISDAEFERLYDKSKRAAFSWIDDLNEEDYLSSDKCKLTIFEDKSASFLLATIDKPDVDDDTVLITFNYLKNEDNWERRDIIYNHKNYSKK